MMMSGMGATPCSIVIGCYVNLFPLESLLPACKLVSVCKVCWPPLLAIVLLLPSAIALAFAGVLVSAGKSVVWY